MVTASSDPAPDRENRPDSYAFVFYLVPAVIELAVEMEHQIWKYYDVVAIIFEMASHDDFLAPLILSAVCREWREAALSTRRIWRLDRLHRIGASGVLDWVARAGNEHISLRVPLQADPRWLSAVYSLSNRFKHLTITSADGFTVRMYPFLECLDIDDSVYTTMYPDSNGFATDVMATISPATHPVLRTLVISTSRTGFDIPVYPCPTVVELAITGARLRDWVPTLTSYSTTLVELTLHMLGVDTPLWATLTLPRLLVLQLAVWSLSLELKTPSLRMITTRINCMRSLYQPSLTVSTVTSLIVHGSTVIPFHQFPSIIRLYVYSTSVRVVLGGLLDEPRPCTTLQSIVFGCPVAYENEIFMADLQDRRRVEISYGTIDAVTKAWRAAALL